MKSSLVIYSLLSLFSYQIYADAPKVAYGEDNRIEYSEASSELQLLADSTAGMVDKTDLTDLGNSFSYVSRELNERTFGSWFSNGPLCSDERYYNQNMLPNCSGFLVAPDVLVTAGHCITEASECDSRVWVFGWDSEAAKANTIPKNNVYNCKEILNRGDSPKDFAVIRLDRNVSGRAPLRYQETPVELNTEIVVIGHPTGLPTKIAAGAQVKSIEETYFESNLDTFGGNSGSAVFNAGTREIVGILVNGATDYVEDEEAGCFRVNMCDQEPGANDCGGEGVTLISVAELEKFITNVPSTTTPATPSNNEETEQLLNFLDELLGFDQEARETIEQFISQGANINALNFWGQTPIIQAIDNEDIELFKFLLSLGELNFALTDVDGRTIQSSLSELGNDDFQLALENEVSARLELEKIYLTALTSADFNGVMEILKDNRLEVNLKKYPFTGDVVTSVVNSKNIEFIKKMEGIGLKLALNDNTRYLILETRNIPMITFLVSRGFELGYDEGDIDLLWLAVTERNLELVKFLLKTYPSTFDLNKEYESQGSNLLIEAVKSDNLRLIKLVLKDATLETINYVNVDGYTALSYATINGKLQVARFLLRKGATPFIGGSRETKPYYIARDQNIEVFIQLFRSYGDPSLPELKPGGMSFIDIIELAEEGATIRVFPGTYELPRITIYKNLTIKGVGEGVTFLGKSSLDSEGQKEGALTIASNEFKIENVTFSQPSLEGVDEEDNTNISAILKVTNGVSTFKNITFKGASKLNTGSGLKVTNNAKVMASDLLFEELFIGIHLSGKSGLTLEKSNFKSLSTGIQNTENAAIKVKESHFKEFRKKAVVSSQRTLFKVSDSKFSTSGVSGAFSINDFATGVIERNNFDMSEGWVLWVSYNEEDVNLVTHFNSNTIVTADECLEMGKYARTSIKDNNFKYCRDMGIKSKGDAYTLIENNEMLVEKSSGISFYENSTGTILKNTINESYHGVYLEGNAFVEIYFNTFYMIQNYVLNAKGNSSAKFVRNNIQDDDTNNYTLDTTGTIINRRTEFEEVN